MNFEAGAAVTSFEKSKISPILFNMDAADLRGPLANFQASPHSKDEIQKIVRQLNSDNESSSLNDGVIEKVFEKWWPDLEADVSRIIASKKDPGKKKEVRSRDDMIEEVLLRIREIQDKSVFDNSRRSRGQERATQDLVARICGLSPDNWTTYYSVLSSIAAPLSFLAADPGLQKILDKRISEAKRKADEEKDDEIPF